MYSVWDMESESGLNIKAVAELTGVPLHTLRAWERRYGVPRPSRHAENRYRLYDDEDIADVLWMKQQVDAGVTPAVASARFRQQREQAHALPLAALPLENLRSALYNAFARRDEAAAEQILTEAWSTFTPEQALIEVVQPTLREIGNNWQRNTLSVEQEHFASNLVRQRLHALIQAQPRARLNAPRVIAACAPEEQHDLGLLMFTLFARRQGWDVNYLGQRTPLAELYRIAPEARYVVISVSTVTGLASLANIWSAPLPDTPLLFGGDIFNVVPKLREHIPGGYLGKNGVEAVRLLETIPPRSMGWKPPRALLRAAEALDLARFTIASETVQKYLQHAPTHKGMERNSFRAALTHAALFLTDALVSALAFDAPVLMELQGAWAAEFLPAHEIPLESLHPFFKLYNETCKITLSPEAAHAVSELVMRLMDSIEQGRQKQ